MASSPDDAPVRFRRHIDEEFDLLVSSALLRTLIVRALWIGAALLPLLAVTGLLGVWLAALGDYGAAAAVRGIFFVLGTCLGLDFVALVLFLAIAILRQLDHDEPAG